MHPWAGGPAPGKKRSRSASDLEGHRTPTGSLGIYLEHAGSTGSREAAGDSRPEQDRPMPSPEPRPRASVHLTSRGTCCPGAGTVCPFRLQPADRDDAPVIPEWSRREINMADIWTRYTWENEPYMNDAWMLEEARITGRKQSTADGRVFHPPIPDPGLFHRKKRGGFMDDGTIRTIREVRNAVLTARRLLPFNEERCEEPQWIITRRAALSKAIAVAGMGVDISTARHSPRTGAFARTCVLCDTIAPSETQSHCTLCKGNVGPPTSTLVFKDAQCTVCGENTTDSAGGLDLGYCMNCYEPVCTNCERHCDQCRMDLCRYCQPEQQHSCHDLLAEWRPDQNDIECNECGSDRWATRRCPCKIDDARKTTWNIRVCRHCEKEHYTGVFCPTCCEWVCIHCITEQRRNNVIFMQCRTCVDHRQKKLDMTPPVHDWLLWMYMDDMSKLKHEVNKRIHASMDNKDHTIETRIRFAKEILALVTTMEQEEWMRQKPERHDPNDVSLLGETIWATCVTCKVRKQVCDQFWSNSKIKGLRSRLEHKDKNHTGYNCIRCNNDRLVSAEVGICSECQATISMSGRNSDKLCTPNQWEKSQGTRKCTECVQKLKDDMRGLPSQ